MSLPLLRPLRRRVLTSLALLVACGGNDAPEMPQVTAHPRPAGTLRETRATLSTLDRTLSLPGSPVGLAEGNGVLLMANRYDPWGFLRLRRTGDGAYAAEKVAMVESWYQQPLGFDAVAWNGAEWVAVTEGGYLGHPDTEWFTVHDADDLHMVRAAEAPPKVGCLAWDGTGYWAATRKDTEASGDTAWVYRLSPELAVLARSRSPGAGCQGMAFDGDFLWLADVFSGRLYALDVWGAEPRLVRTVESGIDYLSGVEAFEGGLWIVEYGDDRLARVSESVRLGAPQPSRR